MSWEFLQAIPSEKKRGWYRSDDNSLVDIVETWVKYVEIMKPK
jgi:hypothetical protein